MGTLTDLDDADDKNYGNDDDDDESDDYDDDDDADGGGLCRAGLNFPVEGRLKWGMRWGRPIFIAIIRMIIDIIFFSVNTHCLQCLCVCVLYNCVFLYLCKRVFVYLWDDSIPLEIRG